MNISKLLATPLGTFLKAFVVAVLTLLMAKHQEGVLCIDKKCLLDVLTAACFATLPVVINYLNPQYKNYGVGTNE